MVPQVKPKWIYSQRDGRLYKSDGIYVDTGYAGKGDGKNNPSLQNAHNVGPIPQGLYIFGWPIDDTGHTGPYSWPLYQSPENEMFGRNGFRGHGDNKDHTASEGCIIFQRATRLLWTPGDILKVVEQFQP